MDSLKDSQITSTSLEIKKCTSKKKKKEKKRTSKLPEKKKKSQWKNLLFYLNDNENIIYPNLYLI